MCTCTWLRSRTGGHRPPSCCGKATARPGRGQEPHPGQPVGLADARVAALSRVLKNSCCPPRTWTGRSRSPCSLPHGHVAAVLAGPWGGPADSDRVVSRHRTLAMAMAVAQVIDPGSKLAIARALRHATAASPPGQVLGAGCCDEDDLYEAMRTGPAARQQAIEDALAARHLLAAPWSCTTSPPPRSRWERAAGPHRAPQRRVQRPPADRLRAADLPEGIPVNFADPGVAGNTGHPRTVASQVTKVKDRFGITKVVLVGDRGMLTAARLREDCLGRGPGLDHRAARPAGSRSWSGTPTCISPCSMSRIWLRSPPRTSR